MIDVYIVEILEQYSSSCNRLTQNKIIHYLDANYNVTVNRNTLADYLRELKEQGYIEGERGVYKIRKFTNSEISILIKSVMYSKAIPQRDIEKIIKKLREMAEPEVRSNILQNIYYVGEMNYTDNENVCDVMEVIDEAIKRKKKIEIVNCAYDLEGKLREIKSRVVDPYYIVAEKSRYYLLCYAGRNDIEPRRIDRISRVHILDKNRIEIDEIKKYVNHTFNVADYMREHIYMYSGESERITLKVKKENIGDFIDWFGKQYRVISAEDEVTIQIKANLNAVYFWALQYGEIAEVIAPKALRERIKKGAEQIAEKYK